MRPLTIHRNLTAHTAQRDASAGSQRRRVHARALMPAYMHACIHAQMRHARTRAQTCMHADTHAQTCMHAYTHARFYCMRTYNLTKKRRNIQHISLPPFSPPPPSLLPACIPPSLACALSLSFSLSFYLFLSLPPSPSLTPPSSLSLSLPLVLSP